MNTSSKLYRPAAAALAAGGLCWVAKFVVIAATDGAESGLPDTVTSVLYISAVLLMAPLGLAVLGFALTAGRHVLLRVLAGVVGLVGWAVSYLVIEAISQGIIGKTDPAWLHTEIGIVTTGAVLMTAGLLLLRSAPDRDYEALGRRTRTA